jgi:hypothetical protein
MRGTVFVRSFLSTVSLDSGNCELEANLITLDLLSEMNGWMDVKLHCGGIRIIVEMLMVDIWVVKTRLYVYRVMR